MNKKEYLRELNKAAFLLQQFGYDYPAEHEEYLQKWIALYEKRSAYGVTMEEALAIKNNPFPC